MERISATSFAKIFGVLSASIIIGIIWGFWHLPLIFAYGHNLVIAIVSIVCHSILMGWILNSTKGSMLMMLLFHASINVGVNMLSPGHESVIMLIITVGSYRFGSFSYHQSKLKPFNHTETLEHKINLGRA
jgi:membrane protease YdiL (CAAX protease family)